jgi:hypothetical protein
MIVKQYQLVRMHAASRYKTGSISHPLSLLGCREMDSGIRRNNSFSFY